MTSINELPTQAEAEDLLCQAERMNPGPWIGHSLHAGRVARLIAEKCRDLDPDKAYILGSLHDIGRRYGVTDMRHTLDGYSFLQGMGYDAASRICMTHSFPTGDIGDASGKWDCDDNEYEFAKDYLLSAVYDDYDRLIQLCDAIALPNGFVLIEKRLVGVALRHGFNDRTPKKWESFLDIKALFDERTGRSIYQILPGIVETTFGF